MTDYRDPDPEKKSEGEAEEPGAAETGEASGGEQPRLDCLLNPVPRCV